MSERRDMELIAELVPPGSRVLDLGCGDGELLALLRDTRRCSGYGVEIADENVLACTRRGVDVIVREQAPSLGDPVEARVTYPYRAVAIRSTKRPVYVKLQGRP